MSSVHILENILLVLALSVGVVVVFHRLKLPPIAGLIVAGILVGPHGLSAIGRTEEVEALAELGVVLLLFSIGLDFSIHRLRRTWKVVLEAGTLYVILAGLSAYATARALGLRVPGGVFVGFWIALSSTAIVLRTLSDRGEMDTPYGKLVISVLLLQDLCVVPMILLLPVLAGGDRVAGPGVVVTLARAGGIVLAVLFVSRYVVPPLLAYLAHAKNRELFLMFVLLLALGTAWASTSLGLSAALGAFLGGLLLSKSDYGLQALSDILPFRDVFNSIFFMSIGMLLDLRFFAAHPVEATLAGLAILVGKAVVGTLVAAVLGFHLRVAALAGIALAQVGEFSFVLGRSGRELDLVPEQVFQTLLAASVLTMAVTPVLIALAPRMARRVERVSRILPSRRGTAPAADGGDPSAPRLRDHIVIVGYGLNGRNLAGLLRKERIPYLVLDLNARIVREASEAGEPILFGDVTSPVVLGHLGLDHARMVVVSISDAEATRRAVRLIRDLAPDVHILVRTRYVSTVDELIALGANEVVPEEFETSLEIAARTLAAYGKPVARIRDSLEPIREDSYRAMRAAPAPGTAEFSTLRTPGAAEVDSFRIPAGSPAAGLSIEELDPAGRSGATLLALVRGDETIPTPNASLVLQAGDVLVLLGRPEQLDAARCLLTGEITLEPPTGGRAQSLNG